MMYDAIKNFNTQFSFEPAIENAERLKKFSRAVVLGMGGSHLAASLLRITHPELPLIIHSDYGLPPLWGKNPSDTLVIASSYSGNTEEVLSGYQHARVAKLNVAALAVGGALLARAKQDGIPFITLPDTGIQPRSALGFSFRALAALLGLDDVLRDSKGLASSLRPLDFEPMGRALARKLLGRVPVIYSSTKNLPIAYNWKIKFNETSKIPAFYNVLPELNHNEMTGFDVTEKTRPLSDKFYFLLLEDPQDNPSVTKRMVVLEELYRARGLAVERIPLQGNGGSHKKIFSSLLTADWAALYTAEQYGVESEQVPMVEEFKKRIA